MYKAKHGLILESKYLIWSLILERKIGKEGEKERKEERKKRKKKEEKSKMYGFCMDFYGLVWILV